MGLSYQFRSLSLKPGLAAGGVTRVGPIDLNAAAAQSVTARLTGDSSAAISTAVMTLRGRKGSQLETIDSTTASATTITVNGAAVRIHDPTSLDELWLDLTTEEATDHTGTLEVTVRTSQDDLVDHGVVRSGDMANTSGVVPSKSSGSSSSPGGNPGA